MDENTPPKFQPLETVKGDIAVIVIGWALLFIIAIPLTFTVVKLVRLISNALSADEPLENILLMSSVVIALSVLSYGVYILTIRSHRKSTEIAIWNEGLLFSNHNMSFFISREDFWMIEIENISSQSERNQTSWTPRVEVTYIRDTTGVVIYELPMRWWLDSGKNLEKILTRYGYNVIRSTEGEVI